MFFGSPPLEVILLVCDNLNIADLNALVNMHIPGKSFRLFAISASDQKRRLHIPIHIRGHTWAEQCGFSVLESRGLNEHI